jgi:DNA-binding transcriptional regulator GbsR (MarR family)
MSNSPISHGKPASAKVSLDPTTRLRYVRKQPKQQKELEMARLTPIAKRFIVHWGAMGERWGINRTVAQIQGLLYLSPRPLNAEEISATLAVARSTVSVGLRELASWGIIRSVHVLGDRTDRFEVKGDVYEMFRCIVDYRKRREVDPTLQMLRESVAELEGNKEDAHTREKMRDMLELFETSDSLFQQAQKIPTKKIVRIAKLGDVVSKVLRLVPE